jgi:hypothetical protein
MAITYNAGTNTITVVGGPYNFTDVYNADVAGGWGVSHLQGTAQFLFDAKIVVGDGTTPTTFSDAGKQIVFSDGVLSANTEKFIYVCNNATFTLGTLADAATKRTRDGCSLFSFDTTYYGYLVGPQSNSALIYLYGCNLYSPTMEAWWQAVNAYNINCNGRAYPHISVYTIAQDYNNVIISGEGTTGTSFGIRRPRSTTQLNNIFILVNSSKIWFQTYAGTVKNVWFRGPSITVRVESTNVDCYVVNADDGGVAWTFSWVTSTGRVFRQYEFDLNVTDKDGNSISGATVTLKDKNGTVVFSVSTAADGTIATQTISRGYYDQAHGNTLQEYSPHTLTITKTGYQTYSKKFALSAKTNWDVKLAKWSQILLDNGKPVLNIVPTNPENKLILTL